MPSTLDRVPAHLRQYVVDQDYDAYDEIDQAVWRFVLLQTYDRLKHTAHEAYVKGLEQTGISVERIPRIEEMDECLGRFGWGAVVVDGFIPPRAFQEFQALGIMTIAAAIRRRRHLAYTPAPDIIHESAGHAPIVPDETYREYLRRFGEIGKKAFSSAEDRAVYEAIRHLSEVKEDRASTEEQITKATKALENAEANVTYLTEAALVSRLHWWTVEYGLVGTPQDYKIYGAGLLSSLGESTHCHRDRVKKVPLSVECAQTGYDITRPQPQLFVARDFEHLNEVLEEFASGLAQRKGGMEALKVMRRSEEVGTVEFQNGAQVTGILEEILDIQSEPVYLRFRGECALAHAGRTLPGQHREDHAHGFGTPIGRLEDGTSLSETSEEALQRRTDETGVLELRFASGVHVSGELGRTQSDEAGRLVTLTLHDARATLGDRVLFEPEWGIFDILVGDTITSCFAGAADPASYYPPTEFSHRRVPHAKDDETAAEEAKVLDLYREALKIWEDPHSASLASDFARLDEQLAGHPEEWLLRWNLLESLRKVQSGEDLQQKLKEELLEIEKTDPEALPITTGLKYLQMV